MIIIESVLSSESVSQWKLEDKFEDKQAPSLLHFKGNRGCFFHGPYKNIGTWIAVSELSSTVSLLNWSNCGFILLWTPPWDLWSCWAYGWKAWAASPAFPNSDGSPVLEWGLHKGLVLPGEGSSGGKHSFISGWLAALRTQRSDSEISKCVILIKNMIKTEPDKCCFRG